MKTSSLMVLLAAATAMIACDRPVDIDRERESLLQTDREWAASIGTRNVDKIVSYWSDDAIVMPPDGPALTGKQAIRDYVAAGLAIPGFDITWEAKQAVISATGDMGYTLASNRITLPGADGSPVTSAGKAVTVWRKEPDGAWRCVLDIWNADPKPGASSVGNSETAPGTRP